MSLKTIGFGAVALGLIAFLVQQLMHELTSPEEKILYALEDAVDEFNDGDMDVMRLFHRDYQGSAGRDNHYGREDVRQAMQFILFSQERYRVELDEDVLDKITLSSDEGSAHVKLEFAIYRNDEDDPWWEAKGTVNFERRGRRWRIASSRKFDPTDR